jgi:AAA+ superfamily predicted ATPase
MEDIKFKTSSTDNGEKTDDNSLVNYDKVDYSFVKNALQSVVIKKTLEYHDGLTSMLHLTNPLAKISLAFILFNPWKTWNVCRMAVPQIIGGLNYGFRSLYAFVCRRQQPCKKTMEICSITDNNINHLYVAFDWYLKNKSSSKKLENYKIMSMVKPIEASKTSKDYPVLETVPESHETTFEYRGCTFNYKRTSKNDVIFAPSGEVKRRNYKLEVWSYYTTDDMIADLTKHILCAYAKSKVNEVWEQKLYTNTGNTWREESAGKNKRKINTVILRNNEHERISELINEFVASENWHLERGIPYKKSFLFYGEPGTGKSSMIKAMSCETQRHIHYLNLSTIKNDEDFGTLMGKIKLEETIVVIEDIDTQTDIVFERGDEIVKDEDYIDEKTGLKIKGDKVQKLTLSAILNHIDGVYNNHNMMLVMTSNHPEKLDKALLRSGRVDERILFCHCEQESIYKMFQNFYRGHCPDRSAFDNIDVSKKIFPCDVENAMRKFSNLPLQALQLVEANNHSLEKF